jgi:hypothetical protein
MGVQVEVGGNHTTVGVGANVAVAVSVRVGEASTGASTGTQAETMKDTHTKWNIIET